MRVTVGDLAWQTVGLVDPAADPGRYWLWRDDDRVLAWAWLADDGNADVHLDPEAPEGLAADVYRWVVANGGRILELLDTEEGHQALAAGAGFRQTVRSAAQMMRPLDDTVAPVTPPEGFVVRSVDLPADLDRRVEVHRRAWDPSRFTTERYAATRAAWPYRQDLDVVVEAPDGRFAASCLGWFIEDERLVEFEPVGADPEFRRLGAASAACLEVLHRARALGAQRALVWNDLELEAQEPARRLYRSLGFEPAGIVWRWEQQP